MTAQPKAKAAEPVRILLVPGSTRERSTNLAALRTANDVGREDVSTRLFTGLADLPLFSPDDDYEPLPGPIVELRRQIALADGVLFSTPEYMGTVPGSFKNLLDWTVGGPEMDGKPVSWINVAPEGRGDGAQQTLDTVSDISAPSQCPRPDVAWPCRGGPSATTVGSTTPRSGQRSRMPY